MKELRFKFIKNCGVWSNECKRISVMSIYTKFNGKTIPKSRSSVMCDKRFETIGRRRKKCVRNSVLLPTVNEIIEVETVHIKDC